VNLESVLATVSRIADDVAAPAAASVDREAAFPVAALSALGHEGVLGLVTAEDHGGMGGGIREASLVVERLAQACGSTAMVACMHFAGTAVLEKAGPSDVRRSIAKGGELATLAFSEVGSRSHFWAPVSTATPAGDEVILDARKSFATSARRATRLVWSSRPATGEGVSALWLVNQGTAGIMPGPAFDGMGLRGNDSGSIVAEGARIPASARLGGEKDGFDLMMGVVLPIFSLMSAGCSLGLCQAAIAATAAHAGATRHEHLGASLADMPTIRARVARMRNQADAARCLWLDTFSALETGRADGMLRVLQAKAVAAEAALDVAAEAMRVCGGAAYRKDLGIERIFRDAQAATVMAPTSDQLYDFIGKAVCGLPLF
jgi:alkylation response protein AidB-like acyl-CoA dehydrogenase